MRFDFYQQAEFVHSKRVLIYLNKETFREEFPNDWPFVDGWCRIPGTDIYLVRFLAPIGPTIKELRFAQELRRYFSYTGSVPWELTSPHRSDPVIFPEPVGEVCSRYIYGYRIRSPGEVFLLVREGENSGKIVLSEASLEPKLLNRLVDLDELDRAYRKALIVHSL
jgi:hypothetical protein